MIWIPSPPLKTRPQLEDLPAHQNAAFVAGLSFKQCATIAEIVTAELLRRGYRRARMGGRTYCAIEARIVTDIVLRDLDLDEIAAQIDEAKWEQETMRQESRREHQWRHADMAKTSINSIDKPTKTYMPTTLAPRSAPRPFAGAMFRDPDKAKPSSTKENANEPTVKLQPEVKCNAFARQLDDRRRRIAATLIRFEVIRAGGTATTRVGGSMWRAARRHLISGWMQFETDLSEIGGEMEAYNQKLEDSDGVYFVDENSKNIDESEDDND